MSKKERKRIYILNYGLNNIRSLYSSLVKINTNPVVINNWGEIKNSDYIVLPGVGAFSSGIDNLKKLGYYDEIINHKAKNKPLLGICLGMQMLFEESEEFGNHKGLGLIDGKVKKLPDEKKMKLPNVGWYSLNFEQDNANIRSKSKFYFNHGYYCKPKDKNIVFSSSTYGNFKFCSSCKNGNIMGTQFHPEKSSTNGLKFLKTFINT
jgi:imidazole glycerol-phosphate synthase subunit HisH